LTARVDKYVFIVNTQPHNQPSHRHRRQHICDDPVAANVVTGGSPTDTDAAADYLGVIDHIGTRRDVPCQFVYLQPLQN
jgi:hypothetical protein